VFSWGQARFYLSGWYGVGSALERLKSEQADIYKELPNQLAQWAPLRYLISNVATSVAAVDGDVISEYAALVEDKALRDLYLQRIVREWDLTKGHVEHIYGGCLDAKRPNVRRMIQLRSQGLRILHNQQIGLLRRWRSYHRMGEAAQADALLPQLLLTVNAIASGLGATG
jgi:phosphoenolpyruvate carboxylase